MTKASPGNSQRERSNPPDDGYYEACWPRGARQQRTRALAPRLATFEGKTVVQNPGRSKLNSVKRFPNAHWAQALSL